MPVAARPRQAPTDRLSLTLSALADPTRRALLDRLARGEATVSELAAPFAISQPAVSRHLKVLGLAGLVEEGREGQYRPRRLRAEALREVSDWLEPYRTLWEGRLDRLEDYLAALQRKAGKAAGRKGRKEHNGNAGERTDPPVRTGQRGTQ